MANILFDEYKEALLAGGIDLSSTAHATQNRVYCALLTSAYTPDSTDDHSTIIAAEVSSANYTAGGEVIATPVVDLSGSNAYFDGDDSEWSNVTFSARYAYLYHSVATLGTKTPIALIDFGQTYAVDSADFTIAWNAVGILLMAHVNTGGTDTWIYNNAKTQMLKGAYNLDNGGDALKVMLTTSSYTPLAAHTDNTDVTNEVTGTGYTAGGEDLTGQVVAMNTVSGRAEMTADPTEWTSASFTAYRAVLYNTTVSDELVAVMTFAANQTVSAGLFRLNHSSAGLVSVGTLT